MPALRVLQVSWEYPPVMYGGLGRHVHALSEALAEQGHDVTVLTQGPPGLDRGRPGDPTVHRVALPPGAPDVHDDTAGFVQVLRAQLSAAGRDLVQRWEPDVVHGHDWVVAQAAAEVAREAHVPLVMTVHATELGLWHGHLSTEFSRWRHRIEEAMVARADRTIVCSRAMDDEVVQGLRADAARTVVIPNGVDVSAWATTPVEQASARASLGLPPDEPVVVLVGRLEWEKGGQDAIAALALLSRAGRRAHLVMVGQGGQRAALAAQAEAAGLADRVHLAGRLVDGQVAALLGGADVALVPSRYEPFGMVALEAMAAGTPVVVARAGGLGDIVVDGETGLLVPPADPDALARAITAVLDDPARAAAMALRARAEADQRFGWAAVARSTAELYSSALARP